jgi:hypothetical protein
MMPDQGVPGGGDDAKGERKVIPPRLIYKDPNPIYQSSSKSKLT